MLGSAKPIAFVATSDPERARSFYGGVLELKLVSADPHALVFDAAGTMLRIAVVERVAPVPYTVLGWQVADVRAVAKALSESGVASERFVGLDQDELGIWTSPSGAKIMWFKDPDGNTLSATQFP